MLREMQSVERCNPIACYFPKVGVVFETGAMFQTQWH